MARLPGRKAEVWWAEPVSARWGANDRVQIPAAPTRRVSKGIPCLRVGLVQRNDARWSSARLERWGGRMSLVIDNRLLPFQLLEFLAPLSGLVFPVPAQVERYEFQEHPKGTVPLF